MPYNRMIPKSGRRFSDKIMRKRQSTNPPSSTIASRLHRRWDRLRLDHALRLQQQIKGGGTPVDADPYPPHLTVRLAPCKARSPAGVPPRFSPKDFRPQGSASGHVSCNLAGAFGPQSPPQPGGGDLAPLRGCYPRRPVPVQRCTSRAGRSAGRHDAQAARKRR